MSMRLYNNPEATKIITSSWTGERFPDGRPKVSDQVLERLRNITLEEAWAPLYRKGYHNQFEGRFHRTQTDIRMVGRAITGVWVPSRPDVHMNLLEYGHKELGYFGFFNQWMIDEMQPYDILVADVFDKVHLGSSLGGNLATSINSRATPGGAVLWGGIRDLEQIHGIEDMQVFYRGTDPSTIDSCMLTAYNMPCRIGDAVCLPGDVVLGTSGGVIFIPPHLAEDVAIAGEKTHIKDIFAFQRLASNTYSGAQIDSQIWSREVMDDFQEWLKTAPEAKDYQHLDWTQDIEDSNNVIPGTFTGLAL